MLHQSCFNLNPCFCLQCAESFSVAGRREDPASRGPPCHPNAPEAGTRVVGGRTGPRRPGRGHAEGLVGAGGEECEICLAFENRVLLESRSL